MATADFRETAGWNLLIDRIGFENVPDGSGLTIGMVEAADGDNYGLNLSDANFTAHTIIDQGPGSPGVSSHANNVGSRYFGTVESMTPSADPIHLYEVSGWCLDGFLRANYSSSTPPLSMPAPIKTWNHSWIGSFGSVNNDQIVLRRLDYSVNRDETIMAVGVDNDPDNDTLPLLDHSFNVISVGLRSGNHDYSDTDLAYEGGGRMKPHICAKSSLTSFATPVVTSAAIMLVDQVRSDTSLGEDGEQPEVVKAVLLAGADHQYSIGNNSWSNQPSDNGTDRGLTIRPLDDVQGAGQVNVDRNHLIMSGGQLFGGVSPPTTPEASLQGWDRAFCLVGNKRTWNFTLNGAVDEVSIVATWNRQVPIGFGTNWTLGDFNLELVKLDIDGEPESMVGSGPEVFESGNVRSASIVDNIEHLYIRGLAAGRYQLQLQLEDGGGASNARAGIAWYFSEPDVFDLPGDINGDGTVNVDDLLQLLAEYGVCTGCPSDLDGDLDTDVDDLLELLNYL
tara:strand:+ start:685 stop:2205 length:1521 start_codon:yes stop_codon:yes gene_type:complete